jgi:hypothetical protein
VTVAEPTATPFTSPVLLTVAIAGALLAHVTAMVWAGTVSPAASLTVAVNCAVPATGILAVAGVTATDATIKLSSFCRSHPATKQSPTNNTFLSRASRRDNLCLNVIISLP